MAKKPEKKEVEVTFDPKKLGVSLDDTYIYGMAVVAKGKKLVGKCDEASAKALKDAGRCE